MNFLKEGYGNLFNFTGRTSVKDFWLFVIFSTVLYTIAYTFFASSPGIRDLYTIIFGFSLLGIQVRRLRDAGKSGLYIFFWLLPIVGPIIILVNFFRTDDY